MQSTRKIAVVCHMGVAAQVNSRLFEIALVLVRFYHIAGGIVNANHSMNG
jgi:hypothetical protein